jgi:hypothetical protein
VDCTLGRAAIGFNGKATNCRIYAAKQRQRRRGDSSVGKATILHIPHFRLFTDG